jgi:hypothetical protein
MNNLLSFKDFVLFEDKETNTTKKLFDLDNKMTYKTIKDLRTSKIGDKIYTFFCVGSGMEAYANSFIEKDKERGEALQKIANNKDKTLVFSEQGIYVVSEAVFNGLVSLSTTIFTYVPDGSITTGISITRVFKLINVYYNNKGKAPFDSMKEDPATIAKTIISDLYKLADSSPKASEAVSVLTVALYKSSPSSFKTIPNFLEDCVYNTAKDLNLKSVKVGQNIEDFYKVAQNTLDNLNIPILKNIEMGLDKMSAIVERGIRKTNIFSTKIGKEAGEALKAAQERIAPTGKAIASKSKPIWDSIFGKKSK